MAVDPSVRIDIAAEFTGKKAFNSADKSANKLGNSATSLGKKLAIAFSTTAVLSFAKASIKAFADEDKAIKSLNRTLNNLGFSYSAQTGAVVNYIDTLSKATGVTDDELRPAFETLLRATGSITKSQDLLSLALDISAGTGKDLSSVIGALQKAYLGNNQALSKLGVGLTKAELATGDFESVTAKLGKLFDGQAADAADSYAGQINKLSIAADNAKEIIGKSLVDAISMLGDEDTTGIDKLTNTMEDFATYIGNAIYALGLLGDKINSIPAVPAIFKWLSDNKQLLGLLGLLSKIGEDNKKGDLFFPTGGTGQLEYDKEAEAAAKLAAKRLADEKKLAAAKLAADKKAAANKAKLAKASSMFDIEKIQIAAALKGKISEEEKTRLLLMQAIADEDADKAEKLSKKLEEIQAKNAKIAADLLAIGATKDPFATWAGSLSLALIQLGKLGKGIADVPNLVAGVNLNPSQNADRNYDQKVAAVLGAITGNGDTAGSGGDVVIESIFAEDDTIDDILTKIQNVAADAAAAAESAAASVAETQVMVDTLATAATNGGPVAGVNFNTGQSADRNFDSGYSNGPTIIVNNNGSVIMQDEFVDAVNNALLAAERTGYNRTPAGFLTI